MGVLAAGAIYIEALRERGTSPTAVRALENLRISIAGLSIGCEPPQCWPSRGGE